MRIPDSLNSRIRRSRSTPFCAGITGYIPGPGPEPGSGWRTALLGSTALGGSGHSLMDAWLDVGGYFRIIRNSLVTPSDVGYGVKVFKDTVPGSPLLYRRTHDSRISEYPNTHWFGSEEDMALLDCFITTEGGPFPRYDTPSDAASFRDTLENGLWFFDRAITFGRGGLGAEGVWQTINTWYDGVPAWGNMTFRNVMIEHEKSSHYWVGYWEWKLRQIHPTLPEAYRIPILPLHRLWIRLIDDMENEAVPGFTSIDQLFSDTIHPSGMGAYASAMLAYAMLYQTDPRGMETYVAGGLYDPIAAENFGKWPVPASAPSGFHSYICGVVMDILLAYEPAGMGGADRGQETWYDPADGDPLEGGGGEPEPGEGALPDDVAITWTADGYTGPAKTGVEPVISDGIVIFDLSGGQGVTVNLPTSGQCHFVAALRVPQVPEPSSQAGLITCLISSGEWSKPSASVAVRFTFSPAGVYAQYSPTTSWEGDITADAGRAEASGWIVVSFTMSSDLLSSYRPLDGSPVSVPIDPPMAAASQVRLMLPDGSLGLVEVAGLALLIREPTEIEVTEMRNWALSRIPIE